MSFHAIVDRCSAKRLRGARPSGTALLVAPMFVALIMASGCTTEPCRPGDNSAACGISADLCGEGTTLVDGRCVPNPAGKDTDAAGGDAANPDAASPDTASPDTASTDAGGGAGTGTADGGIVDGGGADDTAVAVCKPNCDGRSCGDDGCGGTCGACADKAKPFCEEGACVATCTPSCGGASCGSDGCGGSCGTCPGGASCSNTGQCLPAAWTCPPNAFAGNGVCDCGCGAPDPDCALTGLATKGCKTTEQCKEGTCVAGPPAAWTCDVKLYKDGSSCDCQCGAPDPDCAAGKPVSNCASGTCAADGKSCGPCAPTCAGKTCGPDGCGGLCGSCIDPSAPICDGGVCAKTCTPKCKDKSCGEDGCGGICGTCEQGKHCSLDHCQVLPKELSCVGTCGKALASGCSCAADCVPGVTCCPDVKAACGCQPLCDGKSCGSDGCGGVCGTCKKGNSCAAGACVADLCKADTCGGKGVCKDGDCTCLSGYTGKACGSCAPGFKGFPTCKPDLCIGQTCGGKGTCQPTTGKCKCSKDFSGQFCQQCVDSKKTFPACDKPLPPCAGKTCSSQGVCDTKLNKCLCSKGFSGVNCEKCTDPKQTWPKCGDGTCGLSCSGHGGCLSQNVCFCEAGFGGAACELCLDSSKTYPNCGGAKNTNYAPDPAVAGVNCSFCGKPLSQITVKPDAADKTAPKLKVLLPPKDAVIAPSMPIVAVIDDVIDPKSVTPTTFRIYPFGSPKVPVAGSMVAQVTPNKNTVLVFVPSNMSLAGKYTIALNGLKDLGGNTMDPVTSDFSVGGWSASSLDANLSFESPTLSCFIAGDGAVIAATDNIKPTHGVGMLGLTTSDKATIGATAALANQASVAFCGPISVPAGKTKLSFDYNFASSEFDEYVGQQFDDLAIVIASGVKGGVGGVAVSVNTVGKNGILTKAFGLPNEGDAVAKKSGWKTGTISGIGGLGGQIFLTFIVSDVADTAFTSALAVDQLRFQ